MPQLPEDSEVVDYDSVSSPQFNHARGAGPDTALGLPRAHSSTGALAGTSGETPDNDPCSTSQTDSPARSNSGDRHTYNPSNSNNLASNPKLSIVIANHSVGGSAPVLQSKGSGNSSGVGNLMGADRAASVGDHPYLPTQESLRNLSGGIAGAGCITRADLSVWVDVAAKTAESTPTPDMRPKHPLSLDEQAKVLLSS